MLDAALFEIYPTAKVEGNRITTTDYVVVLKLFLCDFMFSENRIEVVPHPEAYALLLSRLSGELRTCSFDADYKLDPADYAGCMAELLKDMEETLEELRRDSELLKELEEMWGPDVCVYVRRAIDKYTQCLLAVADALNSSR